MNTVVDITHVLEAIVLRRDRRHRLEMEQLAETLCPEYRCDLQFTTSIFIDFEEKLDDEVLVLLEKTDEFDYKKKFDIIFAYYFNKIVEKIDSLDKSILDSTFYGASTRKYYLNDAWKTMRDFLDFCCYANCYFIALLNSKKCDTWSSFLAHQFTMPFYKVFFPIYNMKNNEKLDGFLKNITQHGFHKLKISSWLALSACFGAASYCSDSTSLNFYKNPTLNHGVFDEFICDVNDSIHSYPGFYNNSTGFEKLHPFLPMMVIVWHNFNDCGDKRGVGTNFMLDVHKQLYGNSPIPPLRKNKRKVIDLTFDDDDDLNPIKKQKTC